MLAARQHKGVIAAGGEKTQGCVAAVEFQADGLAIYERQSARFDTTPPHSIRPCVRR